jgi:hypothetical protein
MDSFCKCVDSGRYAALVMDSYNLARQIGFDAPSSFIVLAEGEIPKLLRGAHPYLTFERVIDEAYDAASQLVLD